MIGLGILCRCRLIGGRVAIGALTNDGTASNAGHVRIFEFADGSWTQIGADIDGEASQDRSGFSVSLSAGGSHVVIRVPVTALNTGHVRIFEFADGSWTQVGADIDGEAAQDRSGFSVSLSAEGSRVAIGAYLND